LNGGKIWTIQSSTAKPASSRAMAHVKLSLQPPLASQKLR
jgi:hypothetical protein